MISIENTTNYMVDKSGVIINSKTGRQLKYSKNQKGYPMVQIPFNKKQMTKTVHRIVWETFKGKIPKGYEINHIDGNKENNNLENLEIVSHQQNMIKAVEIGLIKKGVDCNISKGVVKICVLTGKELEYYVSIREATLKTGIFESSISLVCAKKRITAGGYKWKFK